MGVVRFYRVVYQKYKPCIRGVFKTQRLSTAHPLPGKKNHIPVDINSYALDINAFAHNSDQKVYKYGAYSDIKIDEKEGSFIKKRERLEKNLNKLDEIPNEKMVFANICNEIANLVRINNPKNQLILAIDGVAGLSKQAQQRQRRFMSAQAKIDAEAEGKQPKFENDSNKISTGTEFMSNFSRYLHIFIQKKLENEWKGLEIVYSNEKVPGEGEHKIIRFLETEMKKHPDWNFCIHSPDADLFMLTLGLTAQKIDASGKPTSSGKFYLFRENAYTDVTTDYFLVDLTHFQELILKELNWTSIDHKFFANRAIQDFILIVALVGNDFVHHVPSIELQKESLELIMSAYVEASSEKGHLTFLNKENEMCIDKECLRNIFFIMASLEKEMLEERHKQVPDPLIGKFMETKVDSSDGKSEDVLNYPEFNKEYYKEKLNGIDPYEVCDEYYRVLLFILRYYLQSIPDWKYCYPYHYSPFFSDLYANIDIFDFEEKFKKNEPFSPFEQLLAVLPPKSSNLLPEALKDLVLSKDSEIIDFYPTKFKVDLDGKRQAYEGHVLLPFIQPNRLRAAYMKISDKLTEEEIKRNKVGRVSVYFNNKDKVEMKRI